MKSLQQNDVFHAMHVVDGALSPDARFAVYQVSATVRGKTPDEDQQLHSLWRVDLDGGEPRRLTGKGVHAISPVISPDGKSLYFAAARDTATMLLQIYRLPLDGGESEAVTALPQGVASFALSPDGKRLAFAATEKPFTPDPGAHVRIDRLSYRFDPVPYVYLQDVPQAVYVVPSEGGEPKAVTAHDGIISAVRWSPDNSELGVATMCKASLDDWGAAADISVIDRDGRETILVHKALALGQAMPLFWNADGSQIGFVGTLGADHSRNFQLWTVSRKGGEPVNRVKGLDLAVGGLIQVTSAAGFGPTRVLFAENGDAIVRVAVGGETAIYRIAMSGPESAEPLIRGPRTQWPLSLVGSTLLFARQDCNTPSELWVADLKTGKERRLTTHNVAWQSEFAWPDVEHVRVTVKDGSTIEGWVLKPKQVKPPYKTILYIHGGPHAGFGYTYNEDFQELVGAGYAVAFCNPRGSTGYGDAFSGTIKGRWGEPELEDFDTFLDELVKRGISDPGKMGVTGVSGGGHLSAWLIGHTNRFKAAVPEQGVYNMFSMYGTSDAGIALISLEMGGHPHEQGAAQRYWDLSPVAHAHKCTTPTLLIQGENDIRCPMGQAEELFTVLKHNGCTTEFLRLKNCSHGKEVAGPPPLRRFRMDAMKDWFARYI